MKVAVIGAGAAGFFAAISAKTHHPNAQVHLFEKSSKTLSKVLISGGGRCNVTHACYHGKDLSKNYPRGEKFLKHAFTEFQVQDTINWFNGQGVELKTESDGRMFPVTNDSHTIANALLAAARQLNVNTHLNTPISAITPTENRFSLLANGESQQFDKVIIASGGSPKRAGLTWLEDLGHEIVDPVPSLFTFNMPHESITQLMGLSVSSARLRVRTTNLEVSGPLLVTHWGMSGPAVLKLSAFGAVDLALLKYTFEVQVNWLDQMKESELRNELELLDLNKDKKIMANLNPFGLPSRLWQFILQKAHVSSEKRWLDLSKKEINKIVNTLTNDNYSVEGKTTFKEEFVTAGGVCLDDIDVNSMQSRKVPGIYFCGEVMNIDGVTGGFNFQAAWTTGWIAGKLK